MKFWKIPYLLSIFAFFIAYVPAIFLAVLMLQSIIPGTYIQYVRH